MDLESLLWIVVFLIYVASVFIKRIRRPAKAKKKAKPKTAGRWQEKLTAFQAGIQGKFGDFMEEVKRELEASKQKDSKEQTGWEKLFPPKEDEPDPVVEKTEPVEVPPEPIRKTVREEVALRWEDAVEKKEPVVLEKEPLIEDLAYGIQDLRRAVIWAEILAPPLALRDDQ